MKRYLLVLMGLLVAACDPPTVNEFAPPSGVIESTVVYPRGTARGKIIVMLFREDELPPPQGSSAPVNFIVIPEAAIFGDAPDGVAGDFSAPFTIPTVRPGRYQLRAFLDADGDFNPLFPLLAQPTAGDVGGAALDPVTGDHKVIVVKANAVTGQSLLLVLGRPYAFERPAFEIVGPTEINVPFSTPPRLELVSHPIQRDQVMMAPEHTRFDVRYVDQDGDGVADDVNGDHLPDLWPKVVLRRMPLPTDDCQPPACSDIIPAIVEPTAFIDGINSAGFVAVEALPLILPPVGVRTQDGLMSVTALRPGQYAVTVIQASGQTWTIPNDLDVIQPGALDPTQSVRIRVQEGPALPVGRVAGTVESPTAAVGDAFVFAFHASAPPPPLGTGRAVGLAQVARTDWSFDGKAFVAPFEVDGLEPGAYLLYGLHDFDGDFSPLVPWFAQPSRNDVITAEPVWAATGTLDVRLEVDQKVPYGPPYFRFDPVRLKRSDLPARFEVQTATKAALGVEVAGVAVSLASGDINGDNLPDLLPQALLTRLSTAADIRLAADENIVIPALVDPISFLKPLADGAEFVSAQTLSIIVPSYALQTVETGPPRLIQPVPSGRYRVHLVNGTLQHWSVPNAFDASLGRLGTSLEDLTQAHYVEIEGDPVPGGSVRGRVSLPVPPEAGSMVVLHAFDVTQPPPPLGVGRPVSTTLVSADAFEGTETATYALSGLSTGRYWLEGFFDADRDFVPWFSVSNQAGPSDLRGGPTIVDVDALGAPAVGVMVAFDEPFGTPRPAFSVRAGAGLRLPGTVDLDALSHVSNLLSVEGRFDVRWVDQDFDGIADDVTGDGAADVFPLVFATLDGVATLQGTVDPATVPGFPSGDLGATASVVSLQTLEVQFAAFALGPDGQPILAPPGSYAVTVVAASGQTWSVPNELMRASPEGSVANSQARSLVVLGD